MVRTNFVLVNLENVQPRNIGLLYGGPFKIKVFLGTTQRKIPLEMARALQAFGLDVEYIQMDGNGTNALDFHIAYYVGRLAGGYPEAYFHIISKDTGFDPLIKHLKGQGISCLRSAAVTDIPMIKVTCDCPRLAAKLVMMIGESPTTRRRRKRGSGSTPG